MAKDTGKENWLTRAKSFIQDVKAELAKVTWPSTAELKASTQVVLLMLAVFALIVYVFDMVFQFGVVHLLSLTS